jgi:hypothetical protein
LIIYIIYIYILALKMEEQKKVGDEVAALQQSMQAEAATAARAIASGANP